MTSAERQARRREQFRQMRDALEEIKTVRTAKGAREIAEHVLAGIEPGKDQAR